MLTNLLNLGAAFTKLQAAEPLSHASVRHTPAEGSSSPVFMQSFTNQKLKAGCLLST